MNPKVDDFFINQLVPQELKFKMEELVTYGEKFRNDFSGTIQKPGLVRQIPGKSGRGNPLLMKVGDKTYQVNRHQKLKKWNNYRFPI